jgi:hypothetical protein
MFGSDVGVGVERVAVAVQARDLDPAAFEGSEEVVSRRVGGEDVVEGGDVQRRQEAA